MGYSVAINKLRPLTAVSSDPPPRGRYPYLILRDAYLEEKPNRDIMLKLYISEGIFNHTRRAAVRSVARTLGEMEKALTTDLTHFLDHAENHRRKRPVGSRMVVLARAVSQCRTPEGGHIHRDGSIAFVAMHLPAGQSFNLLLPHTQDNRRLPDATPECCPGSPSSLIG